MYPDIQVQLFPLLSVYATGTGTMTSRGKVLKIVTLRSELSGRVLTIRGHSGKI